MLVMIPDTPYGRTGAVLSALIVIACVIGLTMHKDFYAGRPRKDFFCFYTNLSNLLVGAYFVLVAPHLYARASLRPLIAHAEFALMMSIMLTFSVFHLMLFPAVQIAVRTAHHTREYLIVCIDNFIVHYLVPWLVLMYWLLCSPDKKALGLSDAFLWTLFPIGYLLFIAIRAHRGKLIEETESPYPYPFLDTAALGRKVVLRMCAMIYGICVAAGLLLVLIVRLLLMIFGSGNALMLI